MEDLGPRLGSILSNPVAAYLEDLDQITSKTSHSRLEVFSAIWARIINRPSPSKVEDYSAQAHRINHNKAVYLVRVRNKAGEFLVDLAKITNKINRINSSREEGHLVG